VPDEENNTLKIGEIDWRENECAFNLYCSDGIYYGADHLRGLKIEVIGNIYENKELSKGS